jgi:hypothetical protein
MLSGGPLLPFDSTFAGMPARATPNRPPLIFVHSIREIFVCSGQKDSDIFRTEPKKIEIDRVLILEHYTGNKVFVSRDGMSAV